jgi:hypothetical protein
MSLRRSTSSTPSRLTLSGPLLAATDSTFNHTSLGFGASFSTSPSACCDAFFVSQGAELKSTTTQALIQLTGSTFVGIDQQSGGNFFGVADTFSGVSSSEVVKPATVSLAGPPLQSTNSAITALFNLIRVRRSTLSSTTGSPLIDITGGSVTLGGTNVVTGSAGLGNLLSLTASDSANTAASAASVSLAGPLASLASTTFAAGNGNVVTVSNGATYTGTGSGAMLQLTNATLTGFNLLSVSELGGAGGTTKATVTLAGPVLSSSSSTIQLGSNVVGVFNGASLTSTTTSPLVQISGGTLTAGLGFSGAAILQVNGGASPGLVTLNGPVLSAGSTVSVPGPLLGTFNGGQLVVNSSTSALFKFTGGTHSFGTATGTDRDAALILRGLTTQTTTETVTVVTDSEGFSTATQSVTVGTRKPVQHGGALIEATGGTLSTNRVMRLDTALLEASAPILSLNSGATMTVSTDGLDLVQNAKRTMTSTGVSLVNLNASTLTLTSGSLLAARLSSFLNVAGDAIKLSGTASLTISNGYLLFASGDSVVKIAGALVNKTASNTVTITNSSGCPSSSCTTKNGLVIFKANSGNFDNVAIGSTPFIGGIPTLTSGSAHIRIDGASTRINIASPGT